MRTKRSSSGASGRYGTGSLFAKNHASFLATGSTGVLYGRCSGCQDGVFPVDPFTPDSAKENQTAADRLMHQSKISRSERFVSLFN